MKHRLRRVLLPILASLIIFGVILVNLIIVFECQYQRATRQRFSQLIGVLLESNPDLDQSALLRSLRSANLATDSTQIQLGEDFFRRYGYFPDEYVTPESHNFARQLSILSLGVLTLFAVALIIYFWLHDLSLQKRINRLVNYLQELNNHIYDLRLEENSEESLSLLTNELYKITITLKEAAEQNSLRRQNLEDALADISHQLRTPLTSLQIMVDNIYDDPDMPINVRQDFLRSISRQIESMSSLVMTLLNLAKLDNGSIKFHNQTISIADLLMTVKANLAVLADLQNIDIKLSGDLDAKINLDPRWQTEALTNIVKNCLEHSPDGSTVMINVQDCPLFLRLSIIDQGEGIDAADLRHIFERFYKAKNSTSSSVGIGLSFAKSVIESGAGQISVTSQPQAGTCFMVTYFK